MFLEVDISLFLTVIKLSKESWLTFQDEKIKASELFPGVGLGGPCRISTIGEVDIKVVIKNDLLQIQVQVQK